MGKDTWGPSWECLSRMKLGRQRPNRISHVWRFQWDSHSLMPPSSSRNTGKRQGRQCKRSRGLDKDSEIQAILRTLAESNGVTIEECNKVLDEKVSIFKTRCR